MADVHISYKKKVNYSPPESEFGSSKEWFDSTMKFFNDLQYREDGGKLTNKWWGMSGNHQSLLKAGLNHRYSQKDSASNGWRVFNSIIGEYTVSLDDKSIVQRRMAALSRMLDIFNLDKNLRTVDPSPSKDYGVETVERKVELVDAIRESVLVTAIKMGDKLSMGGVMGHFGRTYPQYKSEMKKAAKKISQQVEAVLAIVQESGGEAVEELLVVEFPETAEVELSGKTGKKKKPKVELKIEYYYPSGEYEPENVYYEDEPNGIDGSIPVKALIRKIADKKKQDELNAIKPGGPEWPESATGNYTLVLSNDPRDVVLKSTTRFWASSSCENYSGMYKNGPFSDVKYGNCIAYVFNSTEPSEGWPLVFDSKLRARTLLRWGDGDNKSGNPMVGMEHRMYPANEEWVVNIATAIIMIINDAGLFNYKTLKTPYVYKGWGDTQGTNNTQLTYRTEGFTFAGKKINIEESALSIELAIASSPSISYSDMMRLSRMRTDVRVKRELAQNPSVFMHLEALGRLIKTDDLQIIQFLASSPMVPPELLISFAEKSPIWEADYISPAATSLPCIITSHYNCPLEAHQILRDTHPGYGEFTFDDIHYFGLNRASDFMCPAPPELMDDMLEDVRFALKNPKIKLKVAGRVKWHSKYIKMVTNLLMAPYLSNYHYHKLLTQIHEFLSRARLRQVIRPKEGETKEMTTLKGFADARWKYRSDPSSVSGNLAAMFSALETLSKRVGTSFCIPLTSKSDWGFNQEIGGVAIGMGGIAENWKPQFAKNERQNVKNMKVVLTICPEILWYDDYFNGHIFFFETVRDEECLEWVWDSLTTNRTLLKNSDGIFPLEPRFFLQTPRSCTSFTEPSLRPVISNELMLKVYIRCDEEARKYMRWDFLPDSREHRKLRTGVSRPILHEVMSDTISLRNIGVDIVAQWLVDPTRHFELFESLVLKIALRDLWQDGEFKSPPENFEELYNQVEDIGVLDQAALGDGNQTGLVNNPRIPVQIQYALLKDWVDISNTYEGTYGINMGAIESRLAMNPNISSSILEDFSRKPSLKLSIASNPSTPRTALAGAKGRGKKGTLYYEYPVEVLTNTGVTDKTYANLWANTIAYLTTEVDVDVQRLFNLFGPQKSQLVTKKKGSTFRHEFVELLESNKSWVSYWRGGNNKYQKFSSIDKQNIWLQGGGSGGIADTPIPILDKPSILILCDTAKPERNKVYNIDKITVKDENVIYVKGQVYEWDGEKKSFFESEFAEEFGVETFFQYIPTAERGQDKDLYFCEYCNDTGVKRKSQFRSVEEEEVREHYKEAHPELQSRGKYRRYFFREDIDNTHPLWARQQKEGRLAFQYILGSQGPNKWNYDFVFCVTDTDPPESDFDVPAWRYYWTDEMMKKILNTYVQRNNPQNMIHEFATYSKVEGGYKIKASQVEEANWAPIDPQSVLRAVNSQNVWSDDLVGMNLKYLFPNSAALLREFEETIPMTNKLLEAAVDYKEANMKKLGVTSDDLAWVQKCILGRGQVSPEFIYRVQQVALDDAVLTMAKQARLGDPEGYNEYYLKMHPAPVHE